MNLLKVDPLGLEMKYNKIDLNSDQKEKLQLCINQHHFNNKLIIMLPDSPSLPKSLMESVLQDGSHYVVKQLKVQEFLNWDFIQAFFKNGQVYAYSANTRLDIDNSCAFLPNGSLFLLLDQFKYHELGIAGKLSSHILRNPKDKYIVEIDICSTGFSPGKKLYQRTLEALASSDLKFDFYFTWTPKDSEVCPSSLAKYFSDKQYEVREVNAKVSRTIKNDFPIPRSFDIRLNDQGRHRPEDVLEWLGMLALDIDADLSLVEEELSSCLRCSLSVSHIQGFYTPADVTLIIEELRQWLEDRDEESVPWVALTVYGPSDSLVSWSKSESAFKVTGDQFYSLILSRKDAILFTVEESKKPLRTRPKTSNK